MNGNADFSSGHYRPHVANFRAFHHSLQERGVDLSRVSITKSYATLAGIEGYTKTKRKMRAVHEKLEMAKDRTHPSGAHGTNAHGKRMGLVPRWTVILETVPEGQGTVTDYPVGAFLLEY